MAEAKDGDTVTVDYTGRFEDGTVFDTSEGREPFEFTIGAGNVIPGFENAVKGMKPGETKTVTIPAEEAYGPHYDEAVLVVGREEFPPHLSPVVGDQLELTDRTGESFIATVTAADDETVTLDANHPLAGHDLTFDITLEEIK